MLQAYFDESADSKHLIVAGYLASVEKWAAFSDEWAELLGMRSPHYPQLEELHMTEMRSTPERMELVRAYYRVIEKYVDAAIMVAVDIRALKQALALVGNHPALSDFRNPYVAAYQQVIATLSLIRQRYGFAAGAKGEIDFIFDDSNNKTICMEGWELLMKKLASSERREYGDPPIFRSSKRVLPLQAADLLSYWAREWTTQNMTHQEILEMPFPWKKSRYLPAFYMRNDMATYLRHFKTAIVLGQLRVAGCTLINIADILYPIGPLRQFRPREPI
jgi:hypothetical protein